MHFDHEVGRILQSCGIGDELRAITEPAEVYEWRNAAGTTLLRFGRIGAGAVGLAAVVDVLPARARGAPRRAGRARCPASSVRRGVEVTGLEQDDDAVAVAADRRRRRRAGSLRRRLRRRQQHRARAASASPVHDLGFFYDWLIVDVVLDEPRVFDRSTCRSAIRPGPTTAVSGGPGRRRWEFMRLPARDRSTSSTTRPRRGSCSRRGTCTPATPRLERHAVYTFQARYAEQWRAGRVLLAGDAAHQMPPFAGQGMCAGLRDAANLAWKLDLVLAGRAARRAARHLRRRSGCRAPGAAIDFSMELGKVICVPDPAEAAARDEAMLPAWSRASSPTSPSSPASRTVSATTARATGRLFFQGTVTRDGRAGPLRRRVSAPAGGS